MPQALQQILAIEDDPVLGSHLKTSLEARGFDVTLVDKGTHGLSLASVEDFDLILLDVLLPEMNGLELLARLRSSRSTPVLMMSALGSEADRIQGFHHGADDYLPKPFSIDELQVRIAAILRRVAYERTSAPHNHDDVLQFDEQRSDLRYEGRWVGLTSTEYRLLSVLHDSSGEVLSKPFLYQHVLHRGFSRHDRSLDMHISNIRRKLLREGISLLRLESVWGKGYLLERLPG